MKKVKVTVICDLEPPESGEAEAKETIRFGYGAARYEIDACPVHAADLNGYLGTLAGRATLVHEQSAANGSAPRRKRPPRQTERHAAIREWARSRGIEIADHGRIAADVVARYDAGHDGSSPALSDQDRDEIRAAGAADARRSRAAQGLPERIEDPAGAARLAAMLPAPARFAAPGVT